MFILERGATLRTDGICESENNSLETSKKKGISFGLLHARMLYACITRRVMRVLLPLNAVPLSSLRASHEAFNRTSLTVSKLNPVNHRVSESVLYLFVRAKLRTVDKGSSFAIVVSDRVVETLDIETTP